MSKPVIVTNNEVLAAIRGADLISAKENKFPALFTLKLARIMSKLRKEAKLIGEARDVILADFTKYEGEGDDRKAVEAKNEKGEFVPNTVELTDPKAFMTAERKLLDATVELTLPLFVDKDFEGLELPTLTMETLLPFVDA